MIGPNPKLTELYGNEDVYLAKLAGRVDLLGLLISGAPAEPEAPPMSEEMEHVAQAMRKTAALMARRDIELLKRADAAGALASAVAGGAKKAVKAAPKLTGAVKAAPTLVSAGNVPKPPATPKVPSVASPSPSAGLPQSGIRIKGQTMFEAPGAPTPALAPPSSTPASRPSRPSSTPSEIGRQQAIWQQHGIGPGHGLYDKAEAKRVAGGGSPAQQAATAAGGRKAPAAPAAAAPAARKPGTVYAAPTPQTPVAGAGGPAVQPAPAVPSSAGAQPPSPAGPASGRRTSMGMWAPAPAPAPAQAPAPARPAPPPPAPSPAPAQAPGAAPAPAPPAKPQAARRSADSIAFDANWDPSVQAAPVRNVGSPAPSPAQATPTSRAGTQLGVAPPPKPAAPDINSMQIAGSEMFSNPQVVPPSGGKSTTVGKPATGVMESPVPGRPVAKTLADTQGMPAVQEAAGGGAASSRGPMNTQQFAAFQEQHQAQLPGLQQAVADVDAKLKGISPADVQSGKADALLAQKAQAQKALDSANQQYAQAFEERHGTPLDKMREAQMEAAQEAAENTPGAKAKRFAKRTALGLGLAGAAGLAGTAYVGSKALDAAKAALEHEGRYGDTYGGMGGTAPAAVNQYGIPMY